MELQASEGTPGLLAHERELDLDSQHRDGILTSHRGLAPSFEAFEEQALSCQALPRQ